MNYCPPNGRDPNPRPMQRGKDGRDAYQVWIDHQPEGADTRWCAYLNAIRGESAYQIWVEYQPEGSDTSIEAYLDYMAGKKGDPGPANVMSIGTVTMVAPDQPAAAEITGDTPAQVLNLSIPQGEAGKILSVDSITAVGTRTNIVMATPVLMSVTNGNSTVTPILTNVRDVSIYLQPDNGTTTVDLSAWSATALHPRINVRLCCGTNGGGKFTIKPPSTYMWSTKGTYAVPEIITIPSGFVIYDIVNTFGSAPAITKVYPGPDV
jgi:hypothetical protein